MKVSTSCMSVSEDIDCHSPNKIARYVKVNKKLSNLLFEIRSFSLCCGQSVVKNSELLVAISFQPRDCFTTPSLLLCYALLTPALDLQVLYI